jgi:MoaA/NifB/PqqE/SkfB family radical SAM enzyme
MITQDSMFVFIITEQCNLNCSYCLRDAGAHHREIPFDQLKRIIMRAYSMGYRKTGITGGEPLLYSHFRELMTLLGRLKFWVFFETNGCLLDEDRMLLMRSHLGKNLEFLTSLDNCDENANDLQRGAGAHHQTLKAIALIKSHGYRLSINTVISPHNLTTEESLERHIRFTRDLGADSLSLSAVVPLGRAQKSAFFVPPAQRSLIRKVLEENGYFEGYVHGHCAHYPGEMSRRCERLVLRNNAVSPHGIHPCVYMENIKIGELSDFEDRMIDGNLMDSFNDMRRASLSDYQSPFLDCQDCMQAFPHYLEKLRSLVNPSAL